MRSFGKLVLTLGLSVGIAAPALAQFRAGRGGPGGQGGLGGLINLLQNKSVQKELNISEEDVEKVPDALMEALSKTLKPEQFKRLKQIALQQRGPRAFADPKVEKELNLTDDQKELVKTILDDSQKEMRDMFQGARGQGGRARGGRGGADFQAMRDKMAKLNKETVKKVTDVLTADQKKKWKEMVGAPFEIQYEAPAFGGGGGGRRNRGGPDQ